MKDKLPQSKFWAGNKAIFIHLSWRGSFFKRFGVYSSKFIFIDYFLEQFNVMIYKFQENFEWESMFLNRLFWHLHFPQSICTVPDVFSTQSIHPWRWLWFWLGQSVPSVCTPKSGSQPHASRSDYTKCARIRMGQAF